MRQPAGGAVASLGEGIPVVLNDPHFPGPVREPDFLWAGRPVYRCRVCGDRFERIEDLDRVLRHEAEAHPVNVRQSPILGGDGEPILIEETEK